MSKIVSLSVYLGVALCALLLALFTVQQKSEGAVGSGFTQGQVAAGFLSPTDMQRAPDGKLFVLEQAGRLKYVRSNGTVGTFLDFSSKVDSTGERGLLGIAFDPNFATNRFVYLHYTRKATSTTGVHNRVVRVTANATNEAMVAGSEKLILRLNNLGAGNHNGGDIHFGPDGKLYIATGENAVPSDAQSLSNLKGKILRINKSGTIPTNNPYYTRTGGNNRAIWAIGLRNPFKFAFEPGTSFMYINDVGQNVYEEINRGIAGANYGWPACEGAHDYEPTPGVANCNAAPYTPPAYEYAHDNLTVPTGCSITGGAFYTPTTNSFPALYRGDYFFADYCGGWIWTYDRGTSTAEEFATGLGRIVDLEVNQATGELLYLTRDGMVGKIAYTP